MEVTLLDPRHDPEPPYWAELCARAGLWANWAWPVLRAGAWSSRSPLLLATLDRGRAGAVAATVTGAVPRHRFCSASGWPRLGYLHVQAPQSSAQPGWWFATTDPDERRVLFRSYTSGVRRLLGLGAAGVLWRQVGAEDLPLLPRRLLVRRTEPVAVLETPYADRAAWLAGLRRSRRHDLRRIFRALAADPDLVVRTGSAAEVLDPEELVALARLNFDKHAGGVERYTGMRTVAWHRAALERPDVTGIAYRDHAGTLLGAGLVLHHPHRPLWLSWGALPVERGGRRHLYFDLYGRIVEMAVAQRKQAIVLGKGMAELKADLGAKLVPQYAVVTG